jgi:hypothetical protein
MRVCQSQSYVTTDVQSASLSCCEAPSEAQDNIFVIVRQLRVCWRGTPSLTRGLICLLLLLLALYRAEFLRLELLEAHDRIILSQTLGSWTLEGYVPVFISPGTEWLSYPPRHWVPFTSPRMTLRATALLFQPPSSKLKLIYDRQSVGQSVLVSGAHLGPATNFSFTLKFPSDSCGFVIL